MTDPFDLFLAELNRLGGPEPRDHHERAKLRAAFDHATALMRPHPRPGLVRPAPDQPTEIEP